MIVRPNSRYFRCKQKNNSTPTTAPTPSEWGALSSLNPPNLAPRALDPLDFGGVPPTGELRKCSITVEGMTCQSCVSVIQDTVPEKCTNVRSIIVSRHALLSLLLLLHHFYC